MAAARARIHEIARELPSDNRFGGPPARFEDETQGRIEQVDYAAAHAAYDAQSYAQPRHDAYEHLPNLDHQQQYEEHYPQEDPMMTELRPAYDEALQRQEQYRSDRPLAEDDGSGKYARPRGHQHEAAAYNSNSFDAAAYEANYPKAPRPEPSYVGRGESFRQAASNPANPAKSDEFARDDRRDEPRERSSYRDEGRRNEKRFRRDERRDEPRREETRAPRDERANSYQPPRATPRDETRAEGSTANRGGHDDSDGWSDPKIPGPGRVPQELRIPDNFVVGVQPIRTPSMGASAAYPQPMAVIASPNMMATQPPNRSMAPAYNPAATPNAMMMPMMPAISMPPMMSPPQGPMMNQMHVRAHTSARPGGHTPQLTEVEEAQQGSKVGRFAWFVFGAAFGIFFAFAATGFGFGKKDDAASTAFPPPAQLPAPVQTQQPVQTQPVVMQAPPPVVMQQPAVAMQPQAPMQQPMVQQPPVMQQPQLAPVAQQPLPPTGVTVNPGQQMAPIVPAPQPQVRQPTQNQGTVRVRNPAPPPARRGGGRPAPPQNDDDDKPAPKKPSSAEPSVNDLLNAGLGG